MARHTWTTEERIAVLRAGVLSNGDVDVMTNVFHHLFGSEVGRSAVRMQFQERLRTDRSPSWKRLLERIETDEGRREVAAMDSRVRQAASAVGVSGSLRNATATSSAAPVRAIAGNQDTLAATGVGRDADVSMAGTASDTTTSSATGSSDVAGSVDVSKLGAPYAAPMPSVQANFPTHALNQNRLEMVHHTQCVWNVDRFQWDSDNYSVINKDDAIYKHGGKVHRLKTRQSSGRDYMICTQELCSVCRRYNDPLAGPNTPSPTRGRPFVHAGDLQQDSFGQLVFNPAVARSHNLDITASLPGLVNFGELDGVASAICGPECEVCGGQLRR